MTLRCFEWIVHSENGEAAGLPTFLARNPLRTTKRPGRLESGRSVGPPRVDVEVLADCLLTTARTGGTVMSMSRARL